MTRTFDDMMHGLGEVEAFLDGRKEGYKVTVPAAVDVKEIRGKLKMTQVRFSDTFGFSLDAVKHWEGGRRTPEASARAFLTVIDRNPDAVIAALHRPANNVGSPRREKNASAKSNRDKRRAAVKAKMPRAS